MGSKTNTNTIDMSHRLETVEELRKLIGINITKTNTHEQATITEHINTLVLVNNTMSNITNPVYKVWKLRLRKRTSVTVRRDRTTKQ